MKRKRILFSFLIAPTSLVPSTAAASIDWTADGHESGNGEAPTAPTFPEKVALRQCEDLTFSVSGAGQVIKQFSKKGRYKRCDFSDATTIWTDSTGNTNAEVTISGNDFLRRKKHFYGSDASDACNKYNTKILVDVVPTFTKYVDRSCSKLLSPAPIKEFPLNSVAVCESACTQKDDCLGFSFDINEAKPCFLYDSVPTPSGETKVGAACYAAQTECPSIAKPQCSIETEISCSLTNDPTVECSEFAASFRSEVPESLCKVSLKYEYSVKVTTTE